MDSPQLAADSGRSTLQVATWNMDHWQRSQHGDRAWSTLRDANVDVALLQETVRPRSTPRDHMVYRPIGRNRAWGSAVAALRADIAIEEIDTVRTVHSAQSFSMLGSLPGVRG